ALVIVGEVAQAAGGGPHKLIFICNLEEGIGLALYANGGGALPTSRGVAKRTRAMGGIHRQLIRQLGKLLHGSEQGARQWDGILITMQIRTAGAADNK